MHTYTVCVKLCPGRSNPIPFKKKTKKNNIHNITIIDYIYISINTFVHTKENYIIKVHFFTISYTLTFFFKSMSGFGWGWVRQGTQIKCLEHI